MVKLKELLNERKLDEYDKTRVEESLERLNKYTATLNKLWPQIQKSTAKTRDIGVPARCKTGGTLVVHPVHLRHSSKTRRQWSTTREVHIATR